MKVSHTRTATWLPPEGFDKITKLQLYRDRCFNWAVRAFRPKQEAVVVKPQAREKVTLSSLVDRALTLVNKIDKELSEVTQRC